MTFAARMAWPRKAGRLTKVVRDYGLHGPIEKLGLKLEEARRNMPVFVIDKIEETPTEN